MSTTSEIAQWAPPASGRNDLVLLGILSVVAGLVDVIGFLSLDHLFTAHITGNLAVMAAQVATGGPPHIAQLFSIPVFAVAVAVAYVLAHQARASRGRAALLAGQALLLLLVLWLMLRTGGASAPAPTEVLAASMMAVAAMAFQNAFVRVSLHQSSTTSVMTGNVATSVIALMALLLPGPWTRDESAKKLRNTLPLVIGFFAGCAVGAACVARLGPWAWSLPVLLSLVAIPVGAKFPASGEAGFTAEPPLEIQRPGER